MLHSECEWEARERERERFTFPITQHMQDPRRCVKLLEFREEDISLRVSSEFLQQLIHYWDNAQHAFIVSPNFLYQLQEEDIYFTTRLSRRGEDWPQFLEIPIDIVVETQLIYVHIYMNDDIVEHIEFQVTDGQLHINSFGREKVRCLSLIVTTMTQYTFDG